MNSELNHVINLTRFWILLSKICWHNNKSYSTRKITSILGQLTELITTYGILMAFLVSFFFRDCRTNRLRFLFKQPSIKVLDLIFDCAYTPQRKKDKDKYWCYRVQIFLFFLSFSYCFLYSSFLFKLLFKFSNSFNSLLTLQIEIELTLDGWMG